MVGVWVFRHRGGLGSSATAAFARPVHGRHLADGQRRHRAAGCDDARRRADVSCCEETGLTPAELYNAGCVDTFYVAAADTLFHRINFAALVPPDAAGHVLNAEHTAHRWLPLPDLPAALTWASERPVVAAIEREILSDGPSKPHLRIGG